MKKFSALLLTGIIGTSMLFAGFSGSANIDASYDFDSGDYGFANGSNITFDVNLLEEVGSAKGEGEIYAEINATLNVRAYNGAKGDSNNNKLPFDPKFGPVFLPVKASITDAKVYGSNWSVSILGTLDGPDFAKSAIDTELDVEDNTLDDYGFKQKETKKAISYAAPYAKAPGMAMEYDSLSVGVGLYHGPASGTAGTKVTNANLYLGAKDIEIVEGLVASLAVSAAHFTALDESGLKPTERAMGVSGSVAYEVDEIAVKVASDLGVDLLTPAFDGADVAAMFKYDFVTVDAYFSTVGDLLSAKVATDLNSFEVPVALTLIGKDLLTAGARKLSAEAVVTAVEDLKLTVKGSYTLGGSDYSAGVAAEYVAADIGTIAANFDYAKNNVIGLGASVENKTLIDGATLKLAWADGKDLLKKGDDGEDELGAITASCKIAF